MGRIGFCIIGYYKQLYDNMCKVLRIELDMSKLLNKYLLLILDTHYFILPLTTKMWGHVSCDMLLSE